MNPTSRLSIVLASVCIVAASGCGKKPGTAATSATPGAGAAKAATVAAATGTATAETNVIADTTAKLAAAEWALKQDAIKNDPNGQWAVSATASSSYNDAKENEGYAPNQAAGAPNVETYSDNDKAWTPATADSGIEWLDLTYAKPVYATEVRVRESCGSGAIIRVELIDAQGTSHAIWSGADPTTELNYLLVRFPKTAFKVARVKVTLATNVVSGWNEIDAVQLVGTAD